MIAFVLLALGCGLSSGTDEASPEASPVTAPSVSKMKKAKGKFKRPKLADPIGTEGAMLGTLTFEDVPPAEQPDGKAVPAKVAVKLGLTWADDGAHSVDLGTHVGPCREIEGQPVGRSGYERTPLWAVQCGPEGSDKPFEVYVLQVGALLSAIQKVEPSKQRPNQPRYRPVARIPLINGAELHKAEAEAPTP